MLLLYALSLGFVWLTLQVYNQRMDEIRQFMKAKSVPNPMRRRIIAFFNTLWCDKSYSVCQRRRLR